MEYIMAEGGEFIDQCLTPVAQILRSLGPPARQPQNTLRCLPDNQAVRPEKQADTRKDNRKQPAVLSCEARPVPGYGRAGSYAALAERHGGGVAARQDPAGSMLHKPAVKKSNRVDTAIQQLMQTHAGRSFAGVTASARVYEDFSTYRGTMSKEDNCGILRKLRGRILEGVT